MSKPHGSEAPTPQEEGCSLEVDRLAEELPLNPELVDLVERAIKVEWRAMAKASKGGGRYLSPTARFVEALRLTFADHEADDAADVFEPILSHLHRRDRLPYSYTNPWAAAFGEEDSRGELVDPGENFLVRWELVKVSPLRLAAFRATHRDQYNDARIFGKDLSAPRRAPLRRFLALARELAEMSDDGSFFLPVHETAKVLGSDPSTISGWRRLAQKRGLFEQVKAHGPRTAAVFRWVAEARERVEFAPPSKE